MLPPELSEALLLPGLLRGSIFFSGCHWAENGAGEAIQPPKIGFSKKKSTVLPAKYSAFLVENSGIEPLTSCMPCKRSPS